MKLHFTCPETGEAFATEKYSLQKGHRVLMDEHGEKMLQGTVILESGCPICGLTHEYKVTEVGCPFNEGTDEK